MTLQKYQPVCGSCGASVIWLSNERTLKPAPINAEPTPDGNIRIDLRAGTYRILSKTERAQLPLFDGAPPELYTNHFMTCPQAKSWKKAGQHG